MQNNFCLCPTKADENQCTKKFGIFRKFKGDVMRRALSFLALGMLCVVSPACSRTDQAELAKARAEVEAAKAEAVKARAELEGLRAKQAPAVVTNADLRGAGVATFADGKKRPFAQIRSLEVRPGTTTVIGNVGGGESLKLDFRFHEVLLLKGKKLEKNKERKVGLDDLSRITFGPKNLHEYFIKDYKNADKTFRHESPYCEVELEATDGKKERFLCSLHDFDWHRPLTISVQYADGIGTENLEADHLYGMTFRAGK
jgi:hypothetical protein